MRKFKATCCTVLLFLLIAVSPFTLCRLEAANETSTKTSIQETQLSDNDWEVVIDEKKSSNEFEFIQRNLESSNLTDNGQFLLVGGIILLVLSGTGIIFFSVYMYRLCKMSSVKRKPKRRGSRYK